MMSLNLRATLREICRKNKSKQSLWPFEEHKKHSEPLKLEARENLRKRITIGFGLTSDWLRNSREVFLHQSGGVIIECELL